MKKSIMVATVSLMVVAGVAFAQHRKVKDWHDLHNAHMKLQQVIHELERAREANHYDMAGHGAQAEALCRQAEQQLAQAVEAAKGESSGPGGGSASGPNPAPASH